ncbi:MAG: PaaI family thioesterase [Oligoflexia bacterium]
MQSLQEKYAPNSICFGCGPANPKGLRIRSLVASEAKPALGSLGRHDPGYSDLAYADMTYAEWKPGPEHEAFPGMLNGGIIGALLDCHSNWTAAWHLMRLRGEASPPCTVTAEFSVKLLRPTPTDQVVRVEAWVTHSEGDSVQVESQLIAGGKITARCVGKFVAVKPGHPAYHRW